MNILIKLTCLVGLVIAPILGNHTNENSGEITITQPSQTEDVYAESVDADGNFVYNVGKMQSITLPSGKEMKVGGFSTEQKLHRFLSDSAIENTSAKKSDGFQWITLDRVNFQSGSAELMPISKEQLYNIASLMKEFPTAKIKIGGYTDNTGTDEANLKISTDRANRVKAALVKMGIEDSRMQSEGHGANYFICEANDTDICRAKNRRVDIKVVSR